ncbi:thioredoxin family protein [Planctomycetota bacterium]
MLYLKQGLGFVMLGVAAYLIFLFEPGWHLPLIVFCLLLGFALWLGFHVVNVSTSTGRKVWARSFSGIAVLLGAVMLIYTQPAPAEDLTENWLVARLLPLHEKGQTVMVEFTADWCPNCKYVEKTVLKRQAFQDKLTELGVELIIADWTQNDPAITEMLTKLGSKSIPFAAIFGGSNYLNPIILRDIYTLETALSALEEAR